MSRLANILVIVAGALRHLTRPDAENGQLAHAVYAAEIEEIARRLNQIGDDLGPTLPA